MIQELDKEINEYLGSNKYQKTMKVPCEICQKKIKIRLSYASKRYIEWMRHNIEVEKYGLGAAFCWYCWRYKIGLIE